MFEVEYYEKSDGTHPAEEFILSQDVKMKTKLFRLLELLELKGNELRELIQNLFRTEFLKFVQIKGII